MTTPKLPKSSVKRYIKKANWLTCAAPNLFQEMPKVAYSLIDKSGIEPTPLAEYAVRTLPRLNSMIMAGYDLPIQEAFLETNQFRVFVFIHDQNLYITDVNLIDGPLPH